MKAIRTGIVMDPIDAIKPVKDTTLAMMLEAQRRHHELWYFELDDLWIDAGTAFGSGRRVHVRDNTHDWYTLSERVTLALGDLDAILMRKDPPFDLEYIYATYILERAQHAGARVFNNPQAIRDCNEKAYISWFPQCTTPTIIDRNDARLRTFLDTHGTIVVKPLDGMGGANVFVLKRGELNVGVVLEALTAHGTRFAMAQKYIPGVAEHGDRRILLINGHAVPYALARLPKAGESRANLAAGGHGESVALNEREQWLANEIGPQVRAQGLAFVGLDVIGGYVTEINVTSPTCVREIEQQRGINICAQFFDHIEEQLA